MYCNCSISFPKLESPQHIRIFLFDRNMLYSILSCRLLLVLSWETGFETKLDCEILQDCTPVVLWGKKKRHNFYFSLWAAGKHNSLVLQYLLLL